MRVKLRQDLLYRLAVFPLVVPPLRDREGDIEVLAQHFLGELNRGEESEKHFSEEALDVLRRRAWPGNVRELKNVVERSFIMADTSVDALLHPRRAAGAAPPKAEVTAASGSEPSNDAGGTVEIASRHLDR
jgi:transcriptional regulator with GAF, ATPase, and Fis domain